ncbi:MAG: hypothetical protein Q9226_003973 [Calogaya cf. arnoldii]
MDTPSASSSLKAADLDDMAKALIRRLCADFACEVPKSSVSESVYSTAWVSMIPNPSKNEGYWLFPQAFDFVLERQLDDGGWSMLEVSAGDPSWHVGGILSTMAAVLALLTRKSSKNGVPENIVERITRADATLRRMLLSWDVTSSDDVGFEVLVPAHLEMLEKHNLCYSFPARAHLMSLHEQRLRRDEPSSLYGKKLSTLPHCLEGMIGKIDFDRVAHHKVHGGMLCAPASTAAYLMNTSTWDKEAEAYLRNSMTHHGAVEVYPTNIFEITWALKALIETFPMDAIMSLEMIQVLDFLENTLRAQKGLSGMSPGVLDESDDTGSVVYILNRLGRNVDPDAMINRYESADKFRCFVVETNPSSSANANVLKGLLHVTDRTKYLSQIIKAATYIADCWWRGDTSDKWSMTPYYVIMMVSQSLMMLLREWEQGHLPGLPTQLLTDKILPVLFGTAVDTLQGQNKDGSWGFQSRETTAYAILCLSAVGPLPICSCLRTQIEHSIENGKSFLLRQINDWSKPGFVWRSKAPYGVGVSAEAYTLAAMKTSAFDHKLGNAIHDLCNIAKPSLATVEQISHVPLFAVMPDWLGRACIVEGYLHLPVYNKARWAASIHTTKQQRHLNALPFTLIGSGRSKGAFVAPEANNALMVFSALLFEFDHFIEDIVGGCQDREVQELEQYVHDILAQPWVDSMKDPIAKPHGQTSSLDDVRAAILRFTSWVLGHQKVTHSSKYDRASLQSELKSYYLAQIRSIYDSRSLAKSRKSQCTPNAPPQSYHSWAHTIAGPSSGTSVAFAFFTCLMNPHSDGRDCFPSATAKYMAQDLSKHLAIQIRKDNDLGSIVRDRKENTLNSVDFPEFGTMGEEDENLRSKMVQLRHLADYEVECSKMVMARLSELKLDKRVMQGLKAFRNSVDLYGQMYRMQDFSPELEKRA